MAEDGDRVARSRRLRVLSVSTFAVAATIGSLPVQSILSPLALVIVAALLTAAEAARPLVRSPRRALRALGGLAWAVLGLTHLLWLYLGIAWGSVLAWSVPGWGWAAVLGASVAVAFTQRPSFEGVRIAPALPLTLWLALVLLGWRVEESVARCDDYVTVRASDDVSIVATTNVDLDRCTSGSHVAVGRFPRVVFPAVDGERFIVLTSVAIGSQAPSTARFTGAVCETSASGDTHCFGDGKAQGLAESVARDRIFVASWGRFREGQRGRLLALTRRAPLQIVAETPTAGSLGELFYDERADRVYGFTDEGFEILPFVGSTMEAEAPRAAPLLPPGAVHYDMARGEGIACVSGGPIATLDGERFMSVAIGGDPLRLRPLGTSSLALATLTWGCDFDAQARRAYVAIPNLGLLATIDYDSGAVIRTDWIGFAMRAVTLDAARGRLYLTSFLEGYVIALDLDTMREVRRWFVGRFPRTISLARDGGRIFVGSTLGLVSIVP